MVLKDTMTYPGSYKQKVVKLGLESDIQTCMHSAHDRGATNQIVPDSYMVQQHIE